MSSVAKSAHPSRWIISPLWDSLFFVGTPILCLAALLPLRNVWSSVTIWLIVMSFSSFGHHLPGFLRAYGDADLFARYRARFLLAPPLVFAAFLYVALTNLHGAELMLVFWSIWHVMMQHYGFVRIYDAKAGSTGPWAARLDFWLCLSWFAAIAIWSPDYRHTVLRVLYNSGVPFLSPAAMEALYWGITAVTLALTAVYVLYLAAALVTGRPVGWIKVVLHVLSMGFLYLVWVELGDFFFGVAAWEVFHDTQYFAIVWVYNQSMVKKGKDTARLLRFLFRPRIGLVALYLLLVFGYGGVGFASGFVTREILVGVVVAFLGTSTALHYYYDGFIWKVRREETREALSIQPLGGDAAETRPAGWWARWGAPRRPSFTFLHSSLAHAAIFLFIVASLAAVENLNPKGDLAEVHETLASLVPDSPRSFTDLGRIYLRRHRREEARAAFESALALRPNDPEANNGIGMLLLEDGDLEQAAEHIERAMRADPQNRDIPWSLGTLRLKQGRTDEAITLFRKAIVRDGASPDMTTALAYDKLADAYRSTGQTQDSIEARRSALEIRRHLESTPVGRSDGFLLYRRPG
jgi:hypothetical protein